ncbi:MAG: SEL1-like repeat protein [Rhodospirillaceae bacterium]|nr:SEL1-like repeat protein [Rhodospirillaceae bacterium]
MRFIIFLVITGALTMSAGAAYFFFGQPKEDPLAIEMKAFEREIKTVTPVARRGDVRAQYRLGHIYGDANPAFRDYKSALKWYRKAAD